MAGLPLTDCSNISAVQSWLEVLTYCKQPSQSDEEVLKWSYWILLYDFPNG
jgi:hypothetical protein